VKPKSGCDKPATEPAKPIVKPASKRRPAQLQALDNRVEMIERHAEHLGGLTSTDIGRSPNFLEKTADVFVAASGFSSKLDTAAILKFKSRLPRGRRFAGATNSAERRHIVEAKRSRRSEPRPLAINRDAPLCQIEHRCRRLVGQGPIGHQSATTKHGQYDYREPISVDVPDLENANANTGATGRNK